MNVALVLPTLEVGGQERLVAALAEELILLGISAEVVALVEGGPLRDELTSLRVPFTILPPRAHLPGYPAALLAFLDQRRPTLLHSHSGSWFPTAIAGHLRGIPVVHAEHGLYPNERPWAPWIDRLSARHTARVVVVSDALQSVMQRRLRIPSPPELIPNGVALPPPIDAARRMALRARLGLPADALVVGTVARLVPVKDHALLLRAFEEVARQLTDTVCVIVGDGPLRESLALQVAASGYRDRILLTGARADAAELTASFDIYVSSSLTEGTPLAVLEAMASGSAVVATEVGGLRLALDQGQAGLLVPPGDSTALAAAILALGTDAARRAELGGRARRRIESHYSITACARNYARLYEEVVGSTRTTRQSLAG